MAQQEKKPDFVDRFADGLEKFAENLKANPPGYERQKRESKIRAKWFFLCGVFGFLVFLLALWFCEWMGWPKQIYLTVLSMSTLAGVQVVGTNLGNKAVKRTGLGE